VLGVVDRVRSGARVVALKAAKAADTDAAVEALRAGKPAPRSTEPAAEKRWNDAERHLTVVSLALRKEREALAADVVARASEITADLAAKEDAGDTLIDQKLTEIDELLSEKAAIRSHGDFVRKGATGSVGSRQRVGERELRTLRAAVAMQDRATDREEYLRNYDAWKELVDRACASVPWRAKQGLGGEELTALHDAAIEAEIERMTEAGEDVPTPTSIKWAQKLGTGRSPRGQGTGWAGMPKVEPVEMEPDLESAKARHRDIVRA
jgi:hypothetical protein